MDYQTLRSLTTGLPVPDIRYFVETGSTNDEALGWAAAGAPDGCLVVADRQASGRGRLGRKWVTCPGVSLAFSLILRPSADESARPSLFAPLGALAVSQALEVCCGLAAQIKWPNDVLLERRKVAGILVEIAWTSDRLDHAVLGIGMNVSPRAVPPADALLFPATSVEEAAGSPVDRDGLLRAILEAFFYWRKRTQAETFIQAWENRLAFKGEQILLEASAGATKSVEGELIGIDLDGSLLVRTSAGAITAVAAGDLHLRPKV